MALPDYETSPALSTLEKLAIRYAVEMTTTPVNIPDDLLDELRRNLGDTALMELTAAIAWENYRARFNHALGVESEGFSQGMFCPVPEHRHAPPAH